MYEERGWINLKINLPYYPTLTDSLLQESYKKALKLNVNIKFIHLLKTELKYRQLIGR
ncbi:sporulation histidine kinase inhibitor Sda [Pseudogracilibacillus auburnensis]|uniref:sporulation histidine kinase inhibitor Sda n=1 Tax=Pseudogracilibacillus auburnensis TaxID=1494959 RepID=UPI0031450ABA